MHNVLPQYHTWHLIRVILLRANFQYHSGGISSGRCPMSYIYDAWEAVFPYDGPQLETFALNDIIKELCHRAPLMIPGQLVFMEFGLQALTFTEMTLLVVNAMARGHLYMEKHRGWEGLSESYKAVKAVREFLGAVPRQQESFLPKHIFEKKVTSCAHYPSLKRIVFDLSTRRDRIRLDSREGIVELTPDEIQEIERHK
jgi:hypothetical protein